MKGTAAVGIENKDGKYRLRLPRSVAKDSARYISTRLNATPTNFKRVQIRAWEIEDDINTSNFDTSLYKYQFSQRELSKVSKEPNLKELWCKYCEFKRSQVCVTTFTSEYSNYTKHIESLPTHDLRKVAIIRDFLLSTRTPLVVKRALMYLSACCSWGVKNGLIKTNPFEGMTSEIRHGVRDIDPFTVDERDAIINAFTAHPTFNHYALFVRFLFLTGCRTGEAIALQWRHINNEATAITFSESYNSTLRIRKTTKTGRSRNFPCNTPLQELLLGIRPLNCQPSSLVFTSPTGKPINNIRFINEIWKGSNTTRQSYKGVVTQLVNEGKVRRYRPQYNTRHTFISMALEAGLTIPQVASLVGNSPTIILRHYAGCLSQVTVPIF